MAMKHTTAFVCIFLCAILLLQPLAFSLKDSKERLFYAFDDALPSAVLEKLIPECQYIKRSQDDDGLLVHDKKTTFWFDLNNIHSPRMGIEEAIVYLHRYALQSLPDSIAADIVGGEWWVQERGLTERIEFHYDKDEAYASTQHKMKFPDVSTVTYLCDNGAPTIIFDMTTDGRIDTPAIPTAAHISHPKMNRHIAFKGNLMHGATGALANNTVSESSTERRLTFMINWWRRKPNAPNCIPFDQPSLDKLSSKVSYSRRTTTSGDVSPSVLSNEKGKEEATGSSAQNQVVVDGGFQHPQGMGTPSTVIPYHIDNWGRSTRHQVLFPPGDLYFMRLPKSMPRQQIYSITWGESFVDGAVTILDVSNEVQVNHLFSLPEPKAIFFYKRGENNQYLAMLEAVLPLSKKYLGVVKVYMCRFDQCFDVALEFQLRQGHLPAAVFHDTERDIKFVKQTPHMTTADIELFWKDSLNQLHPEL